MRGTRLGGREEEEKDNKSERERRRRMDVERKTER